MKKLLIASIAVFALAGCGDQEAAKENNKGVQVDKNLMNVEITLPAMFFEGESKEEIESAAKAEGVKEVRVNDDGSVYYKMSRATHQKMMTELKSAVDEAIDGLLTDDSFSSYEDISSNKDFSSFDIKVDQNAYDNSFDSLGLLGLGLSAAFYNVFDGKDGDDINIELNIIDAATGEKTDTIMFPDDLDNDDQ